MADAEQEIESRLNQADIACNMAGDTLSPVESDMADRKTVDTELHWPTELEDYMLEHGGANFTMNPPHLQLMQSGIICNQLNPQGCGHVVLVVDASGSIDEDKLDLAVTHLELFMSNIDYESLRLIVHSSYVEHDELFMRGEPIDTSRICGGGGTRFRPVYNLIDEGDAPDLVIHFTDMATIDMHDRPEPAYPIVWLVDGSGLNDANEWTDEARERRHKFTPDYGHRINARQ